MTLTESIKAFVLKKRDWRWLAAAAVLALLGSYLQDRPILEQLQGVTVQADKALRDVQPYRVGSIYERESQPWSGLGMCAPVGERPEHASLCDVSVIMIARSAVAHVIATPAVARAIWRDAGWSGRILFSLTILIIAVFLFRQWRQSTPENSSEAFWTTVFTLSFGPIVISLFFAVVLQVLIFLVWVFGQTLVGAGICAATFGGLYHIAMVGLGIVSSADDLQKKAGLVREEITQRLGD